jgi:hypothetical protein
MYELLKRLHDTGQVTAAAIRLFGCAAVRRAWHLLTDARSRQAVEVAERFADGRASEAELKGAWGEARWASNDAKRQGKPKAEQSVAWAAASLCEADALLAGASGAASAVGALVEASGAKGREAWERAYAREQEEQGQLLRPFLGHAKGAMGEAGGESACQAPPGYWGEDPSHVNTSREKEEQAMPNPIAPKIPSRVVIPPRLKAFLCDVHRAIIAGEAATTLESDDLLQDDSVYGGLVDASSALFAFRYFVTNDEHGTETWDFFVTREQVADIATGALTFLDLWKCDNSTCQCRFECSDSYCMYCDGGHPVKTA